MLRWAGVSSHACLSKYYFGSNNTKRLPSDTYVRKKKREIWRRRLREKRRGFLIFLFFNSSHAAIHFAASFVLLVQESAFNFVWSSGWTSEILGEISHLYVSNVSFFFPDGYNRFRAEVGVNFQISSTVLHLIHNVDRQLSWNIWALEMNSLLKIRTTGNLVQIGHLLFPQPTTEANNMLLPIRLHQSRPR